MPPNDNGTSKYEKGISPLDSDFFVKQAKHLLSVAAKFLPKPGGFYLTFYKAHVGFLLAVAAAIHRAKPIKDSMSKMQSNIDAYLKEASALFGAVREIPIDPFTSVPDAWLHEAIRDAKIRRQYEQYWTQYERILGVAITTSHDCLEAGTQIQSATTDKIDVLLTEIESLPESTSVEVIVKQEAYPVLMAFQLRAEQQLEEAQQYAQGALDHVLRAAANVGVAVQ